MADRGRPPPQPGPGAGSLPDYSGRAMQSLAVAGIEEFLGRAGPLLEADEARHNLILGLAGVLRDRPEVYPQFGLWVVEEAGAPVAAALVTVPHNLVLADARAPGALPSLAAAVRESGLPIPGVVGNRPTVDRFQRGLGAARRGRPVPAHGPGGVLPGGRAVRPAGPRGSAPGRCREDRSLILDWLEAFTTEALPGEPFDGERTERGRGPGPRRGGRRRRDLGVGGRWRGDGADRLRQPHAGWVPPRPRLHPAEPGGAGATPPAWWRRSRPGS